MQTQLHVPHTYAPPYIGARRACELSCIFILCVCVSACDLWKLFIVRHSKAMKLMLRDMWQPWIAKRVWKLKKYIFIHWCIFILVFFFTNQQPSEGKMHKFPVQETNFTNCLTVLLFAQILQS